MGFSEQIENARQRREAKPRSWIERKFMVLIVMGIAGYTWYVYVARFCVKMIRGDDDALGGLALGGELHRSLQASFNSHVKLFSGVSGGVLYFGTYVLVDLYQSKHSIRYVTYFPPHVSRFSYF